MKLVCTKLKAVAKSVSDGVPPPATPPSGGKSKVEVVQGSVEPLFDVVISSEEVIGVASLKCTQLLTGYTSSFQTTVGFIPLPSLWNENGIRMALDDERHPTTPTGSVLVTMQLQSRLQ
jgi:hypothetical protein